MNADEDEAEIKIEYFESFELDPLRQINLEQTSKNSAVNNEKVNEEQLLTTDWYKQVNSSGRYMCLFCELSYTTIQTLRNHVKNKHPQNYNEIKSLTTTSLRNKKLKCRLCEKKFKKKLELEEHINTHSLKNIQNSCFKCHATFGGKGELLDHQSSKHKTSKDVLHFCFLCGYSTSKLSHFKQHQNTHTHLNKKKCSYCDYSTNYPPNLRVHERIHTNDKPYVCGFGQCDYRCTSKSALVSHQLKHNKNKNMLYCDKCIYSTVYKRCLKRHIESHDRISIRK